MTIILIETISYYYFKFTSDTKSFTKKKEMIDFRTSFLELKKYSEILIKEYFLKSKKFFYLKNIQISVI